MSSVNSYLEGILTKILITSARETHVRAVVQGVFNNLRERHKQVKNYRFGGSFSRYTGKEYGPFEAGEVAPVPYAYAMVFVANGAAEIFG